MCMRTVLFCDLYNGCVGSKLYVQVNYKYLFHRGPSATSSFPVGAAFIAYTSTDYFN